MVATITGYSLAFIAVAWSLFLLVYYTSRMGVRRLTGLNDSDITKSYFLILLGHAQNEMIAYDDGNDVEDSVYTDDEVLNAIEKKLHENPRFEMRCLFNCPVPEVLKNKFDQESRLDLRSTGLAENAPRDTHLKVIDGGRLAYLTKHEFNSMNRYYELVDCLTVAPWVLRRVARAELGQSLNRFNERFQAALSS